MLGPLLAGPRLVAAAVTGVPRRLGAVGDQMLRTLDSIAADVTLIARRLEPVPADLAATRERMAAVEKRFAGLEERLTALTALESAVPEPLADIRERVASMEAGLEELAGRLPDPDAPGPIEKVKETLTPAGPSRSA